MMGAVENFIFHNCGARPALLDYKQGQFSDLRVLENTPKLKETIYNRFQPLQVKWKLAELAANREMEEMLR